MMGEGEGSPGRSGVSADRTGTPSGSTLADSHPHPPPSLQPKFPEAGAITGFLQSPHGGSGSLTGREGFCVALSPSPHHCVVPLSWGGGWGGGVMVCSSALTAFKSPRVAFYWEGVQLLLWIGLELLLLLDHLIWKYSAHSQMTSPPRVFTNFFCISLKKY